MPHRLKLLTMFAVLLCTVYASAQDNSNVAADVTPTPLKVWLPAPLISDESGVAFQLLSDHTAKFSTNNNIDVDFRIKDVGKVGGIMATIRAGKEIASAALPDVALIRRRDFTPTQASEYLQSMETLFSSSLISDLEYGVIFGQIPVESGAALFGLPYLFDLLLSVYYQPLENFGETLTFHDVLTSEANFLFPAARTNGLNQTFYLQYLSAGGLPPSNGVMTINEDALQTVLEFYEDLVHLGFISPDVLTYQTPSAYLSDFINRADILQLAIFNVSNYLAMIDQHEVNVRAAKIPTPTGDGLSVRDGWLWVIAIPDLSRQALAARFLEWMMEPGFHASFAKALYHLPSQPDVLEESLPAAVDSEFFAELLGDAALPLPEGEGGTAPRLMQEALIDVLHGDATAAEATRQALSQLAER